MTQDKIKVALVQMRCGADPEKNLSRAGRSWFSGVGNKVRQDRRLRLLGPMVSGGGTTDSAARRGNYFLSDGDRVASERERRIWRGPTFRLGNHSTEPRDCERLLRRRSESRRPRSAGWRRRY